MRKKVFCPLDLMLPKRNRVKVREYQFTFYYRATDSEGSDYSEKIFSYDKPVKYTRAYHDFLAFLKQAYIPCDYIVVERVVYDVIYVRQTEVLFATSCYDDDHYWPF